MRSILAALLLVVACARPAPPPPAPVTASDPPAPIAPGPGPTATPTPPPTPTPTPTPTVAPDPRAIGFVSAQAAYRSADRDTFEDLDATATRTIAACFDRTMPLDQRQPVVYYVRVRVPNPARAPDTSGGFGFHGPSSGIAYPAPGTYPAFEACVTAAIPSYDAPPDVATVELRLHVYTAAQAKGTLGHGRGRP